MGTCGELFGAGSPVPTYLEEVASVHRRVLGDGLIALYLHGSSVQGDFHPGKSDLDILGVVAGVIGADEREALVAGMKHEALPVPAFGLELILCSTDAVRAPGVAIPYEFALSTGSEWGVQVEARGTTSDSLVHMQLCRQASVALAGPPACDVLAAISPELLRAGLMGEMFWHREDLRTDPGDPSVTNAVLNAARSLHAVETGEIISKTEGGKRWLARHPGPLVVTQALAFREGRAGLGPDLLAAQEFVEAVIEAL